MRVADSIELDAQVERELRILSKRRRVEARVQQRASVILLRAVAVVQGLTAVAVLAAPPVPPSNPPTIPTSGRPVTDPYRYMEDLAAPEVQQWAAARTRSRRKWAIQVVS